MTSKAGTDLADLFARHFLWVVLIVELIIGYSLNSAFLSPMNISVILFASTLNGLLALGQSLVLISREIDLSVGANLIFAPMLAIYTTHYLSVYLTGAPTLIGSTGFMTGGWEVVLVLTLIYSAAIGLLNGLIVTKLLVPSFITTIGIAFFLKGMANVATNGQPISFRDLPQSSFIGNSTLWDVVPVSFAVFVAIGFLLAFLTTQTKFGMRLYSVGGNPTAAHFAGINTDLWKVLSFVLCGLMVGIAAIMLMSRAQGLDIHQTSAFELNSIAIAVMGGIAISGGRGSLIGTMLATVVVAVLLNILNLAGFGSFYQSAIAGLIVVILAVVYQRRESRRLRERLMVEV
jgi:ribose/xylose/arabinose/galactoside ABC-type transport system permease subunit